MRIPIFTYHPNPDFLSVLESGKLPSKIIRIHLKEYEKRKTSYKRIIYSYFIILVLLLIRVIRTPVQSAVVVFFIAVFAGFIFVYPIFTRVTACKKIISVIKENYPDL